MNPSHPGHILALHSVYPSFEALKAACRDAAILGNFEYTTVKSDKRRYTIETKIPAVVVSSFRRKSNHFIS